MQVHREIGTNQEQISTLFHDTFAASEGPEEGAVIHAFVNDLMANTPSTDLRPFLAFRDEMLIGGIFFSRLCYPNDPRDMFLLSPVAVKTDLQNSGVGQRLINHGLSVLQGESVSFAFTYGDPNYYGKFGFSHIKQDVAQAPLPPSHPEGWLAKPLTSHDHFPLLGTPKCVPALNTPSIW